MDKAFERFFIPPPGSVDCNLFSPSTSTPVTAVSMSPDFGSEADNYRPSFRRLPEENSDGITTDTIVPIEYNDYYTYVANNQVAEVTSDEVRKELNSSIKQ